MKHFRKRGHIQTGKWLFHQGLLILLVLGMGVLLTGIFPIPGRAAVLYITQGGAGSKDGTSWATAYGEAEFPAAIQSADAGDELWVAEGVYRPSTTGDENATFQLKSEVALYGGFTGNETTRDARDWQNNVTVLTGDLAGDDSTDAKGVTRSYTDIRSTNSDTVVTGSGTDDTALLDGFTLCGGDKGSYAGSSNYYCGGGMYNENGNPTIRNCTFSGNKAGKDGGGMYNKNGDPEVTYCTFSENYANYSGGGMGNTSSNPTVTNCTFSGNTAKDNGGGMRNDSSDPIVTNCTFSKNTVTSTGDNETGGGGMANYNESNPEVTNCTFSGNTTSSLVSGGGGMRNDSSDPTVTNCTFSGNTSTSTSITNYGGGGGMYNKYSSPTIRNCTFSGNTSAGGEKQGMFGGGMFNHESDPEVTNCTFSQNNADYGGGGMINHTSDSKVTNCTFSENHAPESGGGMLNYASDSTVTNCIFWKNTANKRPLKKEIDNLSGSLTVTYCVVEEGYTGDGNLKTNPLLGPLQDNGGPTKTYALGTKSSALNRGSSSKAPDTDQRGFPRDNTPDIGAYEYRPHLRILTVDVEGSGKVLCNPVGTSPGSSKNQWCYEVNTSVTLEASPNFPWIFTEWGGDVSGTNTSTTVSMNKNHRVSMTFTRQWGIVASAETGGTISPSGNVTVAPGSDKAFTITPEEGYVIEDVRVDGNSIGAETTYTFTNVTEDHTIAASFSLDRHTLTVEKSGTGANTWGGTITSTPAGIDCTGQLEDSGSFDHDAQVSLTATADSGCTFTGWTGAYEGTNNPCIVSMDQDLSITANFHAPTTITVNSGGGGDYTTLQDALDNAGPGDTLELAGGTYTKASGYTITQALTLVGSIESPVILQAAENPGEATTSVLVVGDDSNHDFTVTLKNLTIQNGKAKGGGGILLFRDCTLVAMGCTIRNNQATNAEYGGGGIRNLGKATITNCTFSDNTAPLGGGLVDMGGISILTNCTFSGNVATTSGGGVYSMGITTVANSLFWGNTASTETTSQIGVYVSSDNASGSDRSRDIEATATVVSSVIQSGDSSAFPAPEGMENIFTNPKLGTLGNNGGPTRTYALGMGSSALNAGLSVGNHTISTSGGSNTDSRTENPGIIVTVPDKDQRGTARPQGSAVDMGSVEMEQGTLTVNVSPDVVSPDAGWSVDGGTSWQDAETSLAMIPGTYIVTFKDVANYLTPASRDAVVSKDNETTITGTYSLNSYTITATAGTGGTIDPSGDVTVLHGANQNFIISPDAGYRVNDLVVDDLSLGAIAGYTFEDILRDHTIAVSFTAIPTGTPVPVPTDTPAPTPTDVPVTTATPAPSGTPVPTISPRPLQGDIEPGVTIIPVPNEEDPVVRDLKEELDDPESDARKALENTIREQVQTALEQKLGRKIDLENMQVNVHTSDAYRFEDIPLNKDDGTGTVIVPVEITYRESEEEKVEIFFTLVLVYDLATNPPTPLEYRMVMLEEKDKNASLEDRDIAFIRADDEDKENLMGYLRIRDQSEYDGNPEEGVVSTKYMFLYADGYEGTPAPESPTPTGSASGGGGGGCSLGFFPLALLLALPLMLLKK